MVVRFRANLPNMMVASARLGVGLQSVATNDALGLELVAVEPGREAEFLAQLQDNPFIEYVGFNYVAHIAGDPDDPAWWRQWDMGQIKAPAAWVVTTGSDVVIAIVDTGVDVTHPELHGRTVAGHDFVNDDEDPRDDHGHGTHVAGIAAALGNNGMGIAGTSWGARIMPLKVLDANGDGSYFDIIEAIQYATDHGARVINVSLGGSASDPALQQAVSYARDRGCLIVAAAGNQAGPVLYPAAYAQVLAVGATTMEGLHPGYSNTGPSLDVVAPGGTPSQRIYSLAPGSGYASMYGTSMAAPHVAGLAALIWSVAPALAPAQLQSIIQDTAVKVGGTTYDASGRNDEMGHGLIDAAAAVSRAGGQPTATPTAVIPTGTPQPTTHTLQIPLSQGWNLVSFNVKPADTRPNVLTANLGPAVDVILGFGCLTGGVSYYPDLPANISTLKSLDPGHGYWVKMKEPRAWQVVGASVSPDAPLALCAGWNLAGYFPSRELSPGVALQSLGDAFQTVLGYRDGQGQSYYPVLPPYFSSLKKMSPGFGYWISASRPVILVYPQD